MIGINAGSVGQVQAIRVRLRDLPPPWDAWSGTEMWVTQPQDVCNLPGVVDPGNPACAGTFKMAGLSCDPGQAFFTDWSTLRTVYIHDEFIVPSQPGDPAVYDVQMIDITCDPPDEGDFSPVLEVTNALWGDIGGGFDNLGNAWVAPDGSVDIPTDILSMIAGFSNTPGNPTKLRADIEPCVLDFKINIIDIVLALDGFRGLPYPFAPGQGDCPSDPCTAAAR